MRLPRLTTRRLMIAVVIVAVLLWGDAARRRRLLYRQQAASYAHFERVLLEAVAKSPGGGARFGAQAEYCGQLRRKYERAAARPWLTVPPDQPPPL